MKTEDDSNTMTDSMRQDWSRHYDTIQWGVIAIFMAGIAALIGATFSQDSNQSAWPEVAGYVLIIIGVFYVASFRSFRARLHSGIKNRGPPRLPDRPLFVFRLAGKIGHFRIVLPCGLILLIISVGACWVKGRSEG